MLARWVLAVCACALAVEVSAAERGFYFGVIGGRADYEFNRTPPVVSELPGPVVPPTSGFLSRLRDLLPGLFDPPRSVVVIPAPEVADGHETAWGALVGYRITDYVAAELAYVDLGELEATSEVLLDESASARQRVTLATRGPTFSLLGILPLTEAWDLYVRAGAYFLDSKNDLFIEGPNIMGGGSTTYGADGLVWGAGTQLAFGKHWTARLDFQRYEDAGRRVDPGRFDVDLFSLGVLYRL